MKVLRRILGWLVMLLGGVGVLASMAAVVGVWVFCGQVGESVDRVNGQLTTFLYRVRERSEKVGGWVAGSRGTVETLEQRLREDVNLRTGLNPAEQKAVAVQIRGYVERTRDWLAVAESTAELVKMMRGMLDSLGVVVAAEGREELSSALHGATSELLETRKALDELQAAMVELQESGEEADSGAAVQSLLSRCAGGLGKLERHNKGFTARLVEIERGFERLGNGVQRRITAGALLVTLILSWNGIAQCCLAGWGRRLVVGD